MSLANILIVEDEALTATLLEHLLKHSGYSVVGAVPSGEEAVEKAAELKPDLVLMDIQLIGFLDGIEAARQIRSCCNIPIIYLTAYADEDTLRRARVSEPLGYILKPVRQEELVANIEMALYKSKMDALRQRERELAGILDGLNQGVIAFNNDGRVTFLNPPAETALGLSRAEVQNMSSDEITSRLGSRSPNLATRDIPMKDEEGNVTGRFLILKVTG